jgi:hypothetical protein
METLSANRRIRNRSKQSAGLGADQKRQAQCRTTQFCGSDFLRAHFPKLNSAVYPGLQNTSLVEREFFNSLSNLEKLYGFLVDRDEGLSYPHNITNTFQSAIGQMEKISNLKLAIMRGEGHTATIATVKDFDTRTTLYYIPVEPLFDMLNDNSKVEPAELLLSIFAYLYQVHHIAYYAEKGNYMHYIYKTLEDWILADFEEDSEQADAHLEHFAYLNHSGNELLEKISDPAQLKLFSSRLSVFKPQTKAENELLETAKQAFDLFSKYPSRSVLEAVRYDILPREAYEDNQCISPDQYISFYWSNEDSLYDELWQTINEQLAEYCMIAEPSALQYFDKPQKKEHHNHDFAILFFDLLNRLADTLNDLNHE